MDMFKKINVSLDGLDLEKFKGRLNFNVNQFSQFSITDESALIETLKPRLEFRIKPYLVNVTQIVYPGAKAHTDNWPIALNLYIDSSDDQTYFWKEVDLKKSSAYVEPVAGYSSNYNQDNLVETGRFLAKRNDCFLLDVGSVHSILMSKPNSKRTMIRFCWIGYTFDEIYNSIVTH